MTILFDQIIAGDPPNGGDSGAEFAAKINDNFDKVPLSSENLLISDETALIYGLTGEDKTLDNTLKRAIIDFSSYNAFCANVNSNSLDCAFGKNNENEIISLGKQLAMYSWFINDDKETTPYAELIQHNTFYECISERTSDVVNSDTLLDLIISSPYAKDILALFMPNVVFLGSGLVGGITGALYTVYGTPTVAISDTLVTLDMTFPSGATTNVGLRFQNTVSPSSRGSKELIIDWDCYTQESYYGYNQISVSFNGGISYRQLAEVRGSRTRATSSYAILNSEILDINDIRFDVNTRVLNRSAALRNYINIYSITIA